MKLCVQIAEIGWEAADYDSIDADCDGQYGTFAHGNTRQEALERLREIYEERLEFPDDIEERLEAIEAIAWIDSRLEDKFFNVAKEICGV